MDVIPSLDLLGRRAVRLTHGEFATAKDYGNPLAVLDSLRVPRGSRLHVVDLEGSRSGRPIETAIVRELAQRDLRVQVGGGVRTLGDARAWLDCGAEKVVVGTIAADSPSLLRTLVQDLGAARVIAAIDVRNGAVRVDGWERAASAALADVLEQVRASGVEELLVTDIRHDGAMRGPSFELYRSLPPTLRIIASGGVSSAQDIVALSRLPNVTGCVIGKALLERRIELTTAIARAATAGIPERIIPCLDVRDGRVVKGVHFDSIRDAGDPAECATRYEDEGADELVMLDISATEQGRTTALDTVRRVSEALFIPLTVGGGVRSVDDFRALLRAGADRVAINTAAVRDPQLIATCAKEFGVQAVVLSCDAKEGSVMVRGGRERTALDAVDWCRRAEELGAGEILLTSVDRDGTNEGFDLELTRAVSSRLDIGVIASGGAGRPEDFRDAIERGGARAVLAASLFHDRRLTIGEVKEFLRGEGMAVR